MTTEENYWTSVARRRISRRQALRSAALATIGLAGAGIAGCGGSNPQATPTTGKTTPAATAGSAPAATKAATAAPAAKTGGTFRSVTTGGPPHLDPTQSTSVLTTLVLASVYNRLLDLDSVIVNQDTQIGYPKTIPCLAESWEQPDEVTAIFRLRKGVKWQSIAPVNGRELVADDVKYTYERILDPKTPTSPQRSLYAVIDGIETPDKYTVKFKLKQPDATFVNYLTHWYSSWIIPKEAVDTFGDLKEKAIGTGPYMVDSNDKAVKTVFKKNPNFWQSGKPYLDGSELYYVPDTAARIAGARSGQFDVVEMPYQDLESIKAAIPKIQIMKSLVNTTSAVLMQTKKPPFDNVKVRQAVKYAIDPMAAVDAVFFGKALRGGLVNSLFSQYALDEEESKKIYYQDVNKAKQLLAEAGFPNGFKTKMYYIPIYGPYWADIAQIIKEQLKKVNIDVELYTEEYATHISKTWPEGNFEMYSGPRTTGYEVDELIYQDFHTKGGRNWSKISDPRIDEMAEKQRRALKEPDRIQIVKDIQRLLGNELVPEIPLPQYYYWFAIQPYVRNYFFSPWYTQNPNVWFDK